MDNKTVKIELDKKTLSNLKQNDYNLCFAKKIDDEKDIVWKSDREFLAQKPFSWTSKFEVYAADNGKEARIVRTETGAAALWPEEKCAPDKDGNKGETV